MNIFMLDSCPIKSAQYQCDKHISKMCVENAQLLSTAHRILDGVVYIEKTDTNRNIKRWRLSDTDMDEHLYKATHANHPSNIWIRESKNNYNWLWKHFVALADEYTHRCGKVHASFTKLAPYLANSPKNISSIDQTPIRLAINDEACIIPNDPIESYRKFYQTKQTRFKMVWTRREVPHWFKFIEGN